VCLVHFVRIDTTENSTVFKIGAVKDTNRLGRIKIPTDDIAFIENAPARIVPAAPVAESPRLHAFDLEPCVSRLHFYYV